MTVLHRRLLRLERRAGRSRASRLGDGELDRLLRAEVRVWLAVGPVPLAGDVRAELAAFAAAPDAAP